MDWSKVVVEKRLVIGQREEFHFTWLNEEMGKHFRDLTVTNDPNFSFSPDDVLFVNAHLGMFRGAKCRHKFGVLYPGFGFHPWKRPEQFEELKPLFADYQVVFCNPGPVWESVKRDGTQKNFRLVPFCANTNGFRKTRVRTEFRKIIQVAGHWEHKGRDIAEAAMMLMPYEWELVPPKDVPFYIGYKALPPIYQAADGFLHP